MLTTFNDDPDLFDKKVITGEESWVYGYNRAQSSQWKRSEEVRPKKARQVRSNVKIFLANCAKQFRPDIKTTDFCWRYQEALLRSVSWIGKIASISVLYLRGK